MEDESIGASAMTNWITKLTTRITSGKIVSVNYDQHMPSNLTTGITRATGSC